MMRSALLILTVGASSLQEHAAQGLKIKLGADRHGDTHEAEFISGVKHQIRDELGYNSNELKILEDGSQFLVGVLDDEVKWNNKEKIETLLRQVEGRPGTHAWTQAGIDNLIENLPTLVQNINNAAPGKDRAEQKIRLLDNVDRAFRGKTHRIYNATTAWLSPKTWAEANSNVLGSIRANVNGWCCSACSCNRHGGEIVMILVCIFFLWVWYSLITAYCCKEEGCTDGVGRTVALWLCLIMLAWFVLVGYLQKDKAFRTWQKTV